MCIFQLQTDLVALPSKKKRLDFIRRTFFIIIVFLSADLCAGGHGLLRGHKREVSFRILGTKEHAFGKDAG